MKKSLLLCFCVLGTFCSNAYAGIDQDYQKLKNKIARETGFSFGVDISEIVQRVSPNGKKTSWQTQYYPYFSWQVLNSEKWGKGSIDFSYTATRYWGDNANNLSNQIGVVSSVNDYPSYENNFDQLSYTHTFSGVLSPLSITLGQFPIYNFDGSDYDANQQVNFINFALSQNASDAYPTASLGGYLTYTPNDTWSFSVGFQDAHNIEGNVIETKRFGKKKYTSFVSGSYTPVVSDLGQGAYSLLLYYQPSVPLQPYNSKGWSFNFQQDIGKKWAVFGRANGVSNSPEEIEQSYVLGMVYNNPLNRNELDQIGFAYALNKINQDIVGLPSRKFENVVEAYWSWGIGNMMTITPDFQFFVNPALDTKRHTGFATSLRATVMF